MENISKKRKNKLIKFKFSEQKNDKKKIIKNTLK